MSRRITKLWAAMSRPASFLALPLSLVPLLIAVPMVVRAHANYVRYYQSPPFPAPAHVLTAAQRAQFETLPALSGAVPVLEYHGINAGHDGTSVTQRQFAAQMQMLRLAGFRSVTVAQYAGFLRGDTSGLPARPVLITFDGGRLDSYRGADKVLAREGFTAAMFVVTSSIVSRDPAYLNWTELRRMQRSGRWDIQPEAFQGDIKVTDDARGDQAPFYAVRRYLRSTGEETFSAFQRRVGTDLFSLAEQFRAQNIAIHAIAVPFGDYGQLEPGNDPRIVPYTLGLMKAQFGTVFVADDANPAFTTAAAGKVQARWEALSTTSAQQLYGWLRARDPVTPVPAAAAAAPAPATPPAPPVTHTHPVHPHHHAETHHVRHH